MRELDAALLRGEVDLAVHSAKDVPAQLPDGLVIAAVPPRADPRDALCGAPSLDALPPGARVGTASLRRAAQLRALRDGPRGASSCAATSTRACASLPTGDFDAIVLAAGRAWSAWAATTRRRARSPSSCPRAGQGALLLTARAGDEAVRVAAAALDDARDARVRCAPSATLVRGARAPTATRPWARTRRSTARGTMTLRAFVGRADGSAWVRDDAADGRRRRPSALGRRGRRAAARAPARGEVLGR